MIDWAPAKKSTANQSQGTLKSIYSLGNNDIAGNTFAGNIFIRVAVVASHFCEISHEILRKFELTALEGHPRSSICQLKAHMQLPISH